MEDGEKLNYKDLPDIGKESESIDYSSLPDIESKKKELTTPLKSQRGIVLSSSSKESGSSGSFISNSFEQGLKKAQQKAGVKPTPESEAPKELSEVEKATARDKVQGDFILPPKNDFIKLTIGKDKSSAILNDVGSQITDLKYKYKKQVDIAAVQSARLQDAIDNGDQQETEKLQGQLAETTAKAEFHAVDMDQLSSIYNTNLQQIKSSDKGLKKLSELNKPKEDIYNGVEDFVAKAYNSFLPVMVKGTGQALNALSLTFVPGAVQRANEGQTTPFDIIGQGFIDMGEKMKTDEDYKDSIQGLFDKNAKGENIGFSNPKAWLNIIASGTGTIGAIALGTAAGVPITASGAILSMDDIYNSAIEAGMKKGDATLFSGILAIPMGAMEEMNLPYIKEIKNKFAGKIALETAKELKGKVITPALAYEAFGKNAIRYAKGYGKNVVGEALTGAGQAGIQKVGEVAFDTTKGDEKGFGTKEQGISGIMNDILQGGAEELVGSLLPAAFGVAPSKGKTHLMQDFMEIKNNPDLLEDKVTEWTSAIDALKEMGKIDANQHDKMLGRLNDLFKQAEKIPPTVTNPEQAAHALNLMEEKESVNQQIATNAEGADEVMASGANEDLTQRVADIDFNLKAISKGDKSEYYVYQEGDKYFKKKIGSSDKAMPISPITFGFEEGKNIKLSNEKLTENKIPIINQNQPTNEKANDNQKNGEIQNGQETGQSGKEVSGQQVPTTKKVNLTGAQEIPQAESSQSEPVSSVDEEQKNRNEAADKILASISPDKIIKDEEGNVKTFDKKSFGNLTDKDIKTYIADHVRKGTLVGKAVYEIMKTAEKINKGVEYSRKALRDIVYNELNKYSALTNPNNLEKNEQLIGKTVVGYNNETGKWSFVNYKGSIPSGSTRTKLQRKYFKAKDWTNAEGITKEQANSAGESNYSKEVAANSESPVEIINAIEQEKVNQKDFKQPDLKDSAIGHALNSAIGGTGINISQLAYAIGSNVVGEINKKAYRLKQKGGVGLDQIAQTASAIMGDKYFMEKITSEDVANFISAYPKGVKHFEGDQSKSVVLKDLENAFQKVTGLFPHPSNFEYVLKTVENQINGKEVEGQVKDRAALSEYVKMVDAAKKAFNANKKNLSKQKQIDKQTGVTKEKVTIKANPLTLLKDQIKLEDNAAKQGVKTVKESVRIITRYVQAQKNIFSRAAYKKILGIIESIDGSSQKLGEATIKIWDIIDNADSDLIEVSKTKIEGIKTDLKAAIRNIQSAYNFGEAIGKQLGELVGLVKGLKDATARRKELSGWFRNYIKELQAKGNLSLAQVNSITNKAMSAIASMSNKDIESFVDYAEKVIDNADYAKFISDVKADMKKSKKKTHGRFNRQVREFLSINPENLSVATLSEYIKAVSDLGQKIPSYDSMKNIFDTVIKEVEKLPGQFDKVKTYLDAKNAASDIFKSINTIEDYKKLMSSVSVLKRRVESLIENENLLQNPNQQVIDQYQNVLDYFFTEEGKLLDQYATGISDLKDSQILEIRNTNIDESSLTLQEKTLLDRFKSLSAVDLKRLAPSDLDVLVDIIERTAEGFLPMQKMSEIVNRAEALKFAPEIIKDVNFATNAADAKGNLSRDLKQNELNVLSRVIGLKQGGSIDKYLINPIVRLLTESKKEEAKAVETFYNEKKKSFGEFFSKDNNTKKSMNKIGLVFSMLQSHVGEAPKDWIVLSGDTKEIDKYISELPKENQKKARAKIEQQVHLLKYTGFGFNKKKSISDSYNELVKKFSNPDGTLDTQQLYDAIQNNSSSIFNDREKRIFEAIMEINKDQTTKQQAVNETRGQEFVPLEYYLLRKPLGRDAALDKSSSDMRKAKIKSGSSYSRVKGWPSAIETDVEGLVMESIEGSNADYYITNSNKYANAILNEVANQGEFSHAAVATIKQNIQSRIDFEFEQSNTKFNKIIQSRMAQSLFDFGRAVVELGSAFIQTPFRTGTAKGFITFFNPKDRKLANQLIQDTGSSLGLKTFNRNLESGEEVRSKNLLVRLGEGVITFPEHATLAMAWLPTFKNKFQDLAGEEFNSDKYSNAPAYRNMFKQQILDAATSADIEAKNILGGGLKFEGRQFIKVLPNFTGSKGVNANSYPGKIAGFFGTYTARESREFFDGLKNIRTGRGISKTFGVVAGALAYNVGMALYNSLFTKLTSDDEEEKKKAAGVIDQYYSFDGWKNEMGANMIFLSSSRYGAVGRLATLGAISWMYNTASNKEEQEKIKQWSQSNLFTKPLSFNGGFGEKAADGAKLVSFIPYVSYPIEMLYKDGVDVVGLYKEVRENGFESLAQDKKDAYVLAEMTLNAMNTFLMFKGTQVPMTKKLEQYIKSNKKNFKGGEPIEVENKESGAIELEAVEKVD